MAAWTLTIGEIVSATGGRLVSGSGDARVPRISIDSRTLGGGELFFAIRGERFDGHTFASQALEAGAVGVVVDDPSTVSAAGAAAVIQVGDTTAALQALARHVRRKAGARVVAITGSAGKTTTKEVTAELLGARYDVFRNKGNFNNHIGLPLSLLELTAGAQVAVVELGMNHPGEIRTLVNIAEPDVRVWTNVGDAHMGFFASADAIADAKAEILEAAKPDDVLVSNANDAQIVARAQAFGGRRITFGIEREADVVATEVELNGLEGVRASVATPAGRFILQTPLLGLGNLANVLAATAVATTFGIPVDEIAQRAATLRPAYHRGELLRLPGGITLIDDSYNSSPTALKRALEIVAAARGSARKVAVLGEMLELGEHATALHRECGRAAHDAGVDLLVAVGGRPAEALAASAIESGMPAAAVVSVPNRSDAVGELLKRARPGDLVLVKGSRGIGLDAVVERLKEEYA